VALKDAQTMLQEKVLTLREMGQRRNCHRLKKNRNSWRLIYKTALPKDPMINSNISFWKFALEPAAE